MVYLHVPKATNIATMIGIPRQEQVYELHLAAFWIRLAEFKNTLVGLNGSAGEQQRHIIFDFMIAECVEHK